MLKNQKVSYTLRQKKRLKRLRLTIYCGGEIVVSAPMSFTARSIEKFMREKTEWILRKIPVMTRRGNSILGKRNKDEYAEKKHEAFKLVCQIVEKYNSVYNCTFQKINIRNQKTRWGSCSLNRNLSFNYKIIHLPRTHAEYVVVHELCHLLEFNHSERFWAEVGRTIPDCRRIAREVRKM